jgi:phosphonoacetaldehyde hydrolase
MGLAQEEYNSLSQSEKEEVIQKTEDVFLKNGADFTIRTLSELPQVIDKINGLICEGKEMHKLR